MAFNFPNSPTLGQAFFAGNKVYVWDGIAWNAVNQSSPALIGDVAPQNPVVGQLWFRGTNGALYIYVDDGNSKQWVQTNGPSNVGAPSGKIDWFAMNTAPVGWLKANGALVSRTTYTDLFAAIGTLYGVGDGSTTFGLPDLRGEFVRGFDDGRGIDTGRAFASVQTDALQNITGTIGEYYGGASDGGGGGAFRSFSPTTGSVGSNVQTNKASGYNFDASRVARTSTETRPHNVALLACIKY